MKEVTYEIVHDTGYGVIARKAMRDKRLSIESKAIYAYLISFAGNSGKAFPSVELITNELNITRGRFYKYMKELKDLGFIKSEQQKENGKFKRNIYYLNDTPCIENTYTENTYTENTYTENPYTENRHNNNNKLNNNNINNNNINNNNINNISQAEPDKTPYKKVIDYLNLKTGKSYKHTSNSNRKLIKARINEGYTLEDFYRVIDNKTNEWENTDMNKYLRPSTLFGGKFENYLNQEVQAKNENTRYKPVGIYI